MGLLRCLPVLSLIVLCVSSAPTTGKDISDTKDENSNNDRGLSLLLEDKMFDTNIGHGTPDENDEEEVETIEEVDDDDDLTDGAANGEEDADYVYDSEFDSLPSWYVDRLLGDNNDSQTNTDRYEKHKAELNKLLLNMKLYQVYHSIKTLKSVLNDLTEDERKQEQEYVRQRNAKAVEMKEKESTGGGTPSLKSLKDGEVVIAKQLGALKQDQKERSPRRIKRDLGFGGQDVTRDIEDSGWNDGMPNVEWMIKYDDDDDGYRSLSESGNGLAPTNDFDITRNQIQDLLATFFAADGENAPPRNELNINVGDQSLAQQIWYPSKRGRLHRSSMDRNFLNRLPTLEGMKKRRRTYIPLRRSSRNEQSIQDGYLDDDIMLIRNQIAKLAERLAQNTPRPNGMIPFTNEPASDVNVWFENNPMYNIGIDDNIGDTFGWTDVNLPRNSPDRVAELQQSGTRHNVWDYRPRLQRRSRIVEEPSLPGPYQGYFMEGQLWHDMLSKRSAPDLGQTPKTIKIDGPNAWGNFIFINGEDSLPSDGEWFSQSFGDNIGSNEQAPLGIESEWMWGDGDEDANILESDMTEHEKEWIRRIFGIDK